LRCVTSSSEPLSLTGRGATCLLSSGLAGLLGWVEGCFSGEDRGDRSSGEEELSVLGPAVLGEEEEGDRLALMAQTRDYRLLETIFDLSMGIFGYELWVSGAVRRQRKAR
jgi:hypothetical protein